MAIHSQGYNDDPWHSKYWLHIYPKPRLEARGAPLKSQVESAIPTPTVAPMVHTKIVESVSAETLSMVRTVEVKASAEVVKRVRSLEAVVNVSRKVVLEGEGNRCSTRSVDLELLALPEQV